MDSKYRVIVEQILNNWSALRLAIEHDMCGPNSREVVAQCVDYITQFCLNEPNLQVSDIREALEDIMDEEFDTICEDNSPLEIANLLYRFLLLLKEGNFAQCEQEYQNLPTFKSLPPATQSPPQPAHASSNSESLVSESQVTPMEEDSEWTEIKSRRKK